MTSSDDHGNRPLTFRVAFSTPWFEIEESVPDQPGELPYYRMTGPDGVICLPFTPGGDILMVRQFRPNLGRMTLELPAGGMDGDETLEQAAIREIAEETAHRVTDVRLLGPGRLHLNRNTHQEYFVLAFDAVPLAGAVPEAGIELAVMTRAELRDKVRADEIEQIAALSFLGLATAKLGVDLLSAPMDEIKERMSAEAKRRQGHGRQ